MLGKLIKYDIKSLNRFLIIIHAFLLLFAVLIRIFITGHISESTFSNTPDDTFVLFMMLAFTVGVILISGIYFATSLLITIRFYKHLFSDEGYLTNTLPVTKGQHLLAKTISGSIWGCIDVLLISASLYIAVATPYIKSVVHANEAEFLDAMGCTGAYANITLTHILIFYIVICLFGVIGNIILYYASVALGQLFLNHRVVGAVAAYFGISTFTTIVGFVVLMLTGLLKLSLISDSFSQMEYMISSFKISGTVSVISTIILYIVTYYIMNKKINLN